MLKEVGLELNKFLLFMLLMVAGCSNSVIITVMGHNDRTIQKYRDIVLKAVIYDMEHNDEGIFQYNMIGGVGIEVQVDESKFGVSACLEMLKLYLFCDRLPIILVGNDCT